MNGLTDATRARVSRRREFPQWAAFSCILAFVAALLSVGLVVTG